MLTEKRVQHLRHSSSNKGKNITAKYYWKNGKWSISSTNTKNKIKN